MANWNNKQYDESATAIAKQFHAASGQNGASLTELVEKTARENTLNPEQICRLTRIANVRAWEQKFAALGETNAPDRNVEFDLGDERAVISRLHKDATLITEPTIDKTASYFPDLPNKMAEVRFPGQDSGIYEKYEKLASEYVPDLKVSPGKETLKLRKIAEELEVRCKQASFTWKDSFQTLLTTTQKYNWNEDKQATLEKSALALYGTDILPELNTLRKLSNKEKINISNDKIASLNNYVCPTETPECLLLKKAAKARHDLNTLEQTRKLTAAKIAHFELLLRAG
jgi:hypothetical protein